MYLPSAELLRRKVGVIPNWRACCVGLVVHDAITELDKILGIH